jgi:hypothetical protein
MKTQQYWFPVRPARYGWGWGMPVIWQGWVAYLVFVAAMVGGIMLLVPYGQLAVIAYSMVVAGLFLGVLLWKGEPQRMRDERSP